MTPFQPTRRSEAAFYSDLLGVVKKFFSTAQTLSSLMLTVPEWLDAFANQAAERMITHQLHENARSWRIAAARSGQGRAIHEALMRELSRPLGRRYRTLVAENADLIKTLPSELAARAVRQASTAALAGQRADSLLREGAFVHAARARARMIARTEVAKAQTALTQSRAEDLGLDWYEWTTADDQRVRHSHRKMSGVLVSWSDPPRPEALVGEKNPPAPYPAGGVYNCRCYPAPVLKLSQVSWPHRVFRGGRISSMTLAAFRSVAAGASRSAAAGQ